MANIPLGDFSQARAIPRADNTRVDMSPLNAAGRGAAAIAGGLDDAANVAHRLAEIEREKQERIATAKAQVELQSQTNKTQEVFTQWSQDAADPAYDLEQGEADLAKRLEKIPAPDIPGLTEDRKILFDGSIKNVREDAIRQSTGVRLKLYGDRFKSVFETGMNELTAAATNPDVPIDTLYKRMGLIGQAGTGIVGVDDITKGVRRGQEAISAARVGVLLAQADSVAGLRQLEADIVGNKYIMDGAKSAAYQTAINGKISSLENKAAVAEGKAERIGDRAFNELKAIASSGGRPMPEQVSALLEATRGTPAEQDALIAAETIKINAKLWTAPLAEAREIVKSLDAYKGMAGNKNVTLTNMAYTAGSKIVADRIQLATTYPIESMAREGVEFQALTIDKPQALAKQIEDRLLGLAAWRQKQGLPGIPTNPFTQNDQEQLVGLLNQASGATDVKLGIMGAVAEASPNELTFRQAMAQLKVSGPADYAIGEMMAFAPNKAVANDFGKKMYAGEKILREKSKQLPKEAALRAEFFAEVGTAMPTEDAQTAYNRYKMLYAYKADPGADPESIDQDAHDWAMSLAGARKVEYNGRDIILPFTWSEEKFKPAVERQLTALAKANNLDYADLADDELINAPGENGAYIIVGPDGRARGYTNKAGRYVPYKVKIK